MSTPYIGQKGFIICNCFFPIEYASTGGVMDDDTSFTYSDSQVIVEVTAEEFSNSELLPAFWSFGDSIRNVNMLVTLWSAANDSCNVAEKWHLWVPAGILAYLQVSNYKSRQRRTQIQYDYSIYNLFDQTSSDSVLLYNDYSNVYCLDLNGSVLSAYKPVAAYFKSYDTEGNNLGEFEAGINIDVSVSSLSVTDNMADLGLKIHDSPASFAGASLADYTFSEGYTLFQLPRLRHAYSAFAFRAVDEDTQEEMHLMLLQNKVASNGVAYVKVTDDLEEISAVRYEQVAFKYDNVQYKVLDLDVAVDDFGVMKYINEVRARIGLDPLPITTDETSASSYKIE